LRHNRYPGGVWRRPPPQPTSPRGPLPCAVRPHSRISTGGQAPGGCAHPWRRSAAHSGLLGSILIHSGACSRGKAKTRVSQAASTAGRTAWGRHKRMRCARSDSAHRARPGGLCAPGCALAAPQRGAQRSPRTDIGTLVRLLPTQGQNTVCVTKWRRRRRRRPPPSRCRCCRRRRAQKTQRSREPSQSPPHSHRRSPYAAASAVPPPPPRRRRHAALLPPASPQKTQQESRRANAARRAKDAEQLRCRRRRRHGRRSPRPAAGGDRSRRGGVPPGPEEQLGAP